MGSLKAPGEDGYPALFYKNNWHVVGKSVLQFVHSMWQDHDLIKSINNTLLILIPKVDKPEFINQFRPIALCNTIYKCLTKVVANRIKPLLRDCISPLQVSFVPRCQIQDNIIIAHELIHTMNRMKGRRGFMTIKIDEKAYDRLSWSFIRSCLMGFDFPERLVNIIMACVTSSSFNVLWNRDKSEQFFPLKGIRQGDPLSSYLFVICMDKLSHLIVDAVDKKEWNPIRAGRHGPPISHLLFADDLLLFAEASCSQMDKVLEVLNVFCESSGHRINNSKTTIFLSKNVHDQVVDDIANNSGFTVTQGIGNYLGSLYHYGRNKKESFKGIIQKMEDK